MTSLALVLILLQTFPFPGPRNGPSTVCGTSGTAPAYSTHECHNSASVSTVTPISCTVTGVNSGEGVVIGLAMNGAFSFGANVAGQTDSAGGTVHQFGSSSSGFQTIFVFYLANAASGSHTFQITFNIGTPVAAQLYVAGYNGANCTTPLDSNLGTANNFGTGTVSTSSFSTTGNNETLWGEVAADAGSLSAGAGFAARGTTYASVPGFANITEDGSAPTAGSYSAAFTLSSNAHWTAIGLAIRP